MSAGSTDVGSAGAERRKRPMVAVRSAEVQVLVLALSGRLVGICAVHGVPGEATTGGDEGVVTLAQPQGCESRQRVEPEPGRLGSVVLPGAVAVLESPFPYLL